MPESYDAVIVGAGHNGLVTAGYLARSGLRVLVLESRRVVGGACVTMVFSKTYAPSSPGPLRALNKLAAPWENLYSSFIRSISTGRAH